MQESVPWQQQLECWVEWSVLHSRRLLLGCCIGLLLLLITARAWMWAMQIGQTPLEGRVKLGGRPVEFGTVTVVAVDGSIYQVPLESDGRYRIPHVPRGEVRLAVSSPHPESVFARHASPLPPQARPSGPEADYHTGNETPGGRSRSSRISIAMPSQLPPPSTLPAAGDHLRKWFPIPGKYANPATSGLTAIHAAGGENLDIALEAFSTMD
jgi:hypothetical protein